MLLDMLLQYQEEKDFNIVMEVLSEEFAGSFGRHDFEAALIILDGVRKLLDSGRLSSSWAGPLIESFYKDISSDSKCLKPLEEIWSNLNVQQMETLKLIFQHLNPRAVDTLLHLLLLGQPSQLEQIVEDTIISLVRQDMSCLESLINDSDERIAEMLVPVLSRLEGDTSFKYLIKLSRHSSASVRRMAVRAIGQTHGNQTSAIFDLIDDPDASVRRVILTQMGQSRNEIAEDFLMQYLQNRKFSAAQSEHIMECFRALGKCGSSRSVPFLRKTLLNRKWMAGLRKSAYREGAALALVALKIPEARQVIEKAGRSIRPGLRRIAREAGKELNKGGAIIMSERQSIPERLGHDFLRALYHLIHTVRIYQDNNQLVQTSVNSFQNMLKELTISGDISLLLYRSRFHLGGEKLPYRRNAAVVVYNMAEFFSKARHRKRKFSRVFTRCFARKHHNVYTPVQ